MHIDTRLAQIGVGKDKTTGSLSFPIYHATAYRHPALGESTGFDYTRTANPTRTVLEEAIANLEGGDGGFACSSGMAAIQTILGLFSYGDHLVVSLDLYGGTYRLFEQIMKRYGVTCTYVDMCQPELVEAAITSQTRALFIETPTNPLMQITDLRCVLDIAKRYQLLSIVDNTFMTPYYQRPLELGADIVFHSATKYLAGHNDVLSGLIVTKGTELTEKIGFLHNSIGAVLGPQDCWLVMRGLKTLALRMDRHQSNAIAVVEFLQAHPAVSEVFYPGLPTHPGYDSQTEQASGYSGMVSFRIKEQSLVAIFLKQLQIVSFAESLGGVESLCTYPATQTHADIPVEVREQVGVCNRLLRLSVGIEHPDDLIADLKFALDKCLQIEECIR
ncbi:aminotransferase class I/II-fold pyridoxal phosphate-dependent enzyme [Brevibacillus laterosporus]|uniref:aminotransferase class I/II-fold pyridoxal phosphate-dependent enzyme n=1 Tax=Brevibacillus laterosporus TaxID=1465 RepID=UPI000CE34431|nr:aminotransferase class I/II-fold pyridoxal phosphate-dependent enzyme [Brevibacillus laterosporus]MBG9796398.1 cystathionine gamma-synthase [Brevibacillus laterosporus]MCR8937412.1 aminotransferase class I/II-fold pyridoxal phosphate-dependent enzyme [Brevibacillus laterosporus]MCZ0840051.1 aminotransferase class I/II-fold pyridoxal phosphate-dependent enzyme [Brevibacillus laterosporus]MCZ0843379.1 aminotransferase class I/II-fold pyridoxal phosphate-dependent enzyme [Brevibacillus laterosp